MRSAQLLLGLALSVALAIGCDPASPAGGQCCEPASSPCNPSNARGGWAEDGATCAERTIYAIDGRFVRETDERGCTEWRPVGLCSGDEDGVTSVCCGGVAPNDGG
jgi:hypothetical protein